MPKVIDFNGQRVEFPDNMSDDEISGVLRSQSAQEAPQAPQQTEDKESIGYALQHPGEAFSSLGNALLTGGAKWLLTDHSTGQTAAPQGAAKNWYAEQMANPETAHNAGVVSKDLPRAAAYAAAAFATEGLAIPAMEAAGFSSPLLASALSNAAGSMAGQKAAGEDLSLEKTAEDAALGVVIHTGGELAKKGINALRGILPESLGGISQVNKAAQAMPDYAQRVYQGGDEEAQQAFRAATTDETGNVMLNPSQVANPESSAGKRFIREEQRSRATGTASPYEQNIAQQNTGASFQRAVEGADTGADVQQTAQNMIADWRQKANDLYQTKKTRTQDVLDANNVKQIKLNTTKDVAQNHLSKDIELGKQNLTANTRNTLKAFQNSKIRTIDDLDMWKQTLGEKMSKAYADKETASYNALKEVRDSLRNEADTVIQSIDPNAGSLYKEADQYFAQGAGDFGNKSKINLLGTKENPVDVNNVFLGADSLKGRAQGEINTKDILSSVDDAVARGDIDPSYAQQMREGISNASRSQAFDYANMRQGFNTKTFANRLTQYAPQAEAAGATNVNEALRQAAETMQTQATVGGGMAEAAGATGAKATGAAFGAVHAGMPGAMAGQYAAGRVADIIPRLIDKVSGTAGRSKAMIDFVSIPENAEKIVRAIEAGGGRVETTTPEELTRLIGLFTRFGSQAAAQANQTEQSNPLPTMTQPAPAPTQEFNVIPEQHAQAAKEPESTQFDPSDTRLYRSFSAAETGGIKNRFIRTRAEEAGLSTAWGPAQLTTGTAERFYKKYPELFNEAQKDYMTRFIEQGRRMKEAPKDDPVFGYGKPGTMGDTPEDRKTYADVVRIMLHKMNADNNGDKEKTLREWRYGDKNADIDKRDPAYARKVRQAWKRFGTSQNVKTSTGKSWSNPAA
ncbi:hypothetical protein ND480_002099 [Salmonella enterica subsp. enterica serovar Bareilly]|nr:hypothetical protein [Salmonella enterica subsp. enterica serovar Bareilly]